MTPRRVASAVTLGAAVVAALPAATALASSHREAPLITERPKVDGTDFYMFRSYEKDREEFVTLIANYLPLQDPYGGPNYFILDPNARYDIHVDNNGDAVEDITFRFRFENILKGIAIPVGDEEVPVPVINVGPIGVDGDPDDTENLNVIETFTVDIIRGGQPEQSDGAEAIANLDTGDEVFVKPVDYIGRKTLPDYEAFAEAHVYDIEIPGCAPGRLFVGQREESFVVNLGEIFDLFNLDPLGPIDAEEDDLDGKNITSLVLEVPIDCLTAGGPVIGGWTTASLPADTLEGFPGGDRALTEPDEPPAEGDEAAGELVQVSRLGNPLVNEVVIGLEDKDEFNASEPRDDAQFLVYVTNPTLPELIETLFPEVTAPNLFPRTDLIATFLTGIEGLNQPARVVPSEMQRLNTSIPPTPADQQRRLGVIGGDNAGFPNGRRPGDDVVDIELRVAMGKLIALGLFGEPPDAPSGELEFTDGALVDAGFFDDAFPYLVTPIPGSPSEARRLEESPDSR